MFSERFLRSMAILLIAIVMAIAADESAVAGPMPGDGDVEPDAVRELADLGDTLKAAVLSGAMSEEDAIKIWETMRRRLEPPATPKPARDETRGGTPKRDLVRLAAPEPEQVWLLLQPEFLGRDVTVLRDELMLDPDQTLILDVLLDDYREAFELASAPFRVALTRSRRATADRWITETLQRARIDGDVTALENTRSALEKLAEERGAKETPGKPERADAAPSRREQRHRAWSQRMLAVTVQLEGRLAALRARVDEQLAELDREDAVITGERVLKMARSLRAERARLGRELAELIAAITTAEQRGPANDRLALALARVRVERLLPLGRFGGESMNLWAALSESVQRHEANDDDPAVAAARRVLRERTLEIAGRLDHRAEATLDRELEGLAYLQWRDRAIAANGGAAGGVPARQTTAALTTYAAACRRELAASMMTRDALLDLLDGSVASIEAADSDAELAATYRDAALRRGFPTEMRRRWSERALTSANRLDDLDDETIEWLRGLSADIAQSLAALRADSIRRRLVRDPRLAREQVAVRFGGDERTIAWGSEHWFGINHQTLTEIDDRTEGELRAMLTAEQWSVLPARRRDAKISKEGRDKKGNARPTPKKSG
ncbi:MAG: hypothetical protein KJO43_11280 [Phycisphaerae bacterium]|nr:hypothetical protein [Phycisphaerae bacterium]